MRELENAIERAVVLSGADLLTPEAFLLDADLPDNANDQIAETAVATVAPGPGSLQDCLDRAAGVRIKAALDATNGSRAEAAAALGVDRTTLYRLIKRLEL